MAEQPDRIQVTAEELRDEMITIMADLVMERDALKFGKFLLRANKSSPYQIDVGAMCRGRDTFTIGRAYALAINHNFGPDLKTLVGVPGRGIAMATVASFYYAHMYNYDCAWSFPNLAAAKPDEPIPFCGAPLDEESAVVIVDDILSDGTAIRDTIEMVKKTGAKIMGVCCLIDRRDRTKSNRLASTDIERETGVPVVSCCTVADLVRKMPSSYLSDEKRELVIKHVTVETGPPLLPPFNKLTNL
jgi:orotate phosphoribosyltransferase